MKTYKIKTANLSGEIIRLSPVVTEEELNNQKSLVYVLRDACQAWNSSEVDEVLEGETENPFFFVVSPNHDEKADTPEVEIQFQEGEVIKVPLKAEAGKINDLFSIFPYTKHEKDNEFITYYYQLFS